MVSKWEQPKSFENFHGNTKPRIHMPDPTYMTIREVAELLRVDVQTIKRWEKRGVAKVTPVRINSRGDRRYLRSEIERITRGTE